MRRVWQWPRGDMTEGSSLKFVSAHVTDLGHRVLVRHRQIQDVGADAGRRSTAVDGCNKKKKPIVGQLVVRRESLVRGNGAKQPTKAAAWYNLNKIPARNETSIGRRLLLHCCVPGKSRKSLRYYRRARAARGPLKASIFPACLSPTLHTSEYVSGSREYRGFAFDDGASSV